MASLRHKEQLSSTFATSYSLAQTSPFIASVSTKPIFIPQGSQASGLVSPLVAENASYFKADMKKSFVLILSIITLEIIFYFASMSTSLRSFVNF